MRKDRGRVLRRDKRRTGTSDRDKASKGLEHRTAPPQDRRKHISSSAGGGGGKSSVISMPPDQVWQHPPGIMIIYNKIQNGRHDKMTVALSQFMLLFLWLKTEGVTFYLLLPQVLLLLQGAEPPMLCSRQKVNRPYTEVTVMTLLTSMADKELVHMIAWAKKLPGTALSGKVSTPTIKTLFFFSSANTQINIF